MENSLATVVYLTFGSRFNQELKKDDIPNSITHLTFGCYFNKKLKKDDIPNSVTHLTFGSLFNQELKKDDIPNSVTHLTFGYKFNQTLKKDDIPNSVTHLTFGYRFDKELNKNNLPNKLIEIIFMNQQYDTISLENENYIVLKFDYLNGYFVNKDFKMEFNKKLEFNNYIEDLKIKKENLYGNIILEELVKKVFHPNKINILLQKYNVDIDLY